MKYLLSIIFLFTSVTFVFSQNILDYKEFYLGTGYAVGIRGYGKINQILERHDTSSVVNRVIEKGFNNLKTPNGISFLAGTTLSFFNIEAGFTQLQQRKKSEYVLGDNLRRRDVRLRINSYSLGLGLFFPVESNFGFGVNASFDYHKMSLSTRENIEKDVGRSSYITPSSEESIGTTIQMKFYFGRMDDHGTKFMIIPYYSIIFENLNGSELDTNINGSTVGDRSQAMSHWGVKFIVNYSVRK